MLVEVAGPVVPPGVETGVFEVSPEDVDQTPVLQLSERRTFGLTDVGGAVHCGRVPDIAIFRRDVEVSADDHGRVGITRGVEMGAKAPQPVELEPVLLMVE